MSRLIPSLIVAAVALTAFVAPASAQPYDQINQVRVAYGDLNLTSDTGAVAMLHRLNRASMTACGGRPDYRNLSDAAEFKECRQTALTHAVVDLNAPLVISKFEEIYPMPGIQIASR